MSLYQKLKYAHEEARKRHDKLTMSVLDPLINESNSVLTDFAIAYAMVMLISSSRSRLKYITNYGSIETQLIVKRIAVLESLLPDELIMTGDELRSAIHDVYRKYGRITGSLLKKEYRKVFYSKEYLKYIKEIQ